MGLAMITTGRPEAELEFVERRPRGSVRGSYAFLGRETDAKRYVDELLRLIPRYSLGAVQKNPWFVRSEHIEKLIEGLRLAGLPE